MPIEVDVEGGGETSAVIRRLQEGSATLMRAAAEREAEAERVKEELARRRDFLRHAILELGDLIDEAHRIVARNIAPIEIVRLNPKRSSGTWEFQVTGYTRH